MAGQPNGGTKKTSKVKKKDTKPIYVPVKKRRSQIKSRKEHGNSTRDSDKRNEFIDLIKKDITFVDASAYVGLPEATLYDRIKRDQKLSEEYERAKRYMDTITSNTITQAINDQDNNINDRAKRSFEWKKRRDKRYKDKGELTGEDGKPIEVNMNLKDKTTDELLELKKQLLNQTKE